MKRKIFLAAALVAVFAFAGVAYAAGQGRQSSKDQGETKDTAQAATQTAEQRRNEVANAVQEMLQVAERNGGLGEQVRIIAQNQEKNQEKITASLEKAQERGKVAKFLIGADYGEINKAKNILAQNQEQVKQLKEIKDQLGNQSDAEKLTQQIQTLEQANLATNNSLAAAQKGFSLLGWMFRLFAR